MRTVEEIEAELSALFSSQMLDHDVGTETWKDLAKRWIQLFEGEYVAAVHANSSLEGGRPYFQQTRLHHVHHLLCRRLLFEFLGETPDHPASRG